MDTVSTMHRRALAILICTIAATAALHPQSAPPSPIRFRDVAPASGIDFALQNEPTDRKHLIETMAGSVAAFDYDGDGLTDIYFSNGATVPSLEKAGPDHWNRLYRNLGGMKFEDVTGKAGVSGVGYGIGLAAADYDNDGDTDLFVGGVRQNILYRNRGDGTFEDVAKAAGIRSGLWCEGAAWLDYDNDGLLDLLVINYLQWTPEFDTYCGDPGSEVRAYCHPKLFEGLPNTLYRNLGDGTFEDVSAASGIGDHVGKGMSVAIADYDNDGFIDIFVTNDKLENFLFHNLGDGTFEEDALLGGVALQDHGKAVSSMGADFRDYDNDGLPDVVFAALTGESFPLFRNEGDGMFRDATPTSRMSQLSYNRSGWSPGLYDFDNDGWKDIFVSASHVNDTVEHFEATKYRQPNAVFQNRGDGSFGDVTDASGLGAGEPRAHRGSAFADFNNDGRVDIVVVSLEGRTELWENISDSGANWITLRLTGNQSNRDGIGARMRIGAQHNHMTASVGYTSSSHSGVHFGLGAAETIPEIEILWPSGARQILKDVSPNQILEVREP
jgi:hypothetical protein